MAIITGILHDDVSLSYSYNIISDKSCRENQNSHFEFCNFFQKIVPFLDNV
jgi:hypothetical protein